MPTLTNETKIFTCEALHPYTFTNKLLLLQALNATSLPLYYANAFHSLQKNDALAVLGNTRVDALLCR